MGSAQDESTEKEQLTMSLVTLLNTSLPSQDTAHSQTVKRQNAFRKALLDFPAETLSRFKKGRRLNQLVDQLQGGEITAEFRKGKLFTRIIECIIEIEDLPGLNEIFDSHGIYPRDICTEKETEDTPLLRNPPAEKRQRTDEVP